jgi:hypothetical protein
MPPGLEDLRENRGASTLSQCFYVHPPGVHQKNRQYRIIDQIEMRCTEFQDLDSIPSRLFQPRQLA